ncbi:GerAB/ArcD/ProY family transporter [Bacillus dakarensis]|uniref:GerAB/ArcD/ProY family transporter n=1 Tax=Robertmurraya dakarensis TaxID=1926278 RepID=UPI0009818576|nr:endospore germination permease [Bacillus dakarensis]
MEKKQGTLGLREFFAMTILMIGAKLSDDTPSILYDSLLNAAWMVPIISGILSAIPLYLLFKVMSKHENKNLHDINLALLGRFLGYSVSFILWLIGSFAIITDTRGYVDIISTMYFINTPPIAIYAVLMVVCAYGAKKGIQHIGSVAYVLIFYVKAVLLIAFIFAILDSSFNHIFPIWGPGQWEIVKESTQKVSIFADLLFLALIAPYLTSVKEFKKGTWAALIFLIFELAFSFLIYVLIFDYMPVQSLNYPYHEMIRYIEVGNFLTKVETFFLPLWLIAAFVRFSAYLYLNAVLFGGLFKIKQFELAIPALATTFLFFGLLPETPAITTFVLRETLLNLTSPLFILMPILLWVAALVRGEFKNGKKENL